MSEDKKSKNKTSDKVEEAEEKIKEKPKQDLMSHFLVPQHIVITEGEKKTLLEKYNIVEQQLPKILATDPIVKQIGAKPGNIVKIVRDSQTAGKSFYYRLVVEKVK